MAIWMAPWGLALLAYALFLAWYVNWRGPLSKAEVQSALAELIATGLEMDGRNDLATLQSFLEADDGREFFMLNLVRIAPGDIPDPVSGQPRPARQVMEGYTRMFLPALFARGGHPAIAARKIGGYFDAWGWRPTPVGRSSAICATAAAATWPPWWSIPGSQAPMSSSSRPCRRPIPSRPSPRS
ncbi:MAG: hypothetical protein Q7S93_08865 [Phenylobacterium sp.]|uniref:hypothetical protein n=1 Tax=Phenylobacterium sp. TaxID=1871053 RepID=UPI002726AC27|nr:hypothetical protein [Phenylobacterium sp.]MDO8410159.1 hypothetical protein [Phenylobacterium sp.]